MIRDITGQGGLDLRKIREAKMLFLSFPNFRRASNYLSKFSCTMLGLIN